MKIYRVKYVLSCPEGHPLFEGEKARQRQYWRRGKGDPSRPLLVNATDVVPADDVESAIALVRRVREKDGASARIESINHIATVTAGMELLVGYLWESTDSASGVFRD